MNDKTRYYKGKLYREKKEEAWCLHCSLIDEPVEECADPTGCKNVIWEYVDGRSV